MHNNYNFFTHLVPSMELKLVGSVLTECFSQNKDELILEFTLSSGDFFYIKAYLKNDFSCLSFPTKFHRAKRNSINLFGIIKGQLVLNLKLYTNERAFAVQFGNDQSLLFKLFGNQSNIILLEKGNITELFKNNLKRDRSIQVIQLERYLDISYQTLKGADWDIRKVIPTLDKQSAQLLEHKLSVNNQDKEAIFNSFMNELKTSTFFIEKKDKGYRLSLVESNNSIESFTNPITAINAFFEKEVKYKSTYQLKSKLTAGINVQLIKSGNYITKLQQKLKELSNSSSNQHKGDILMANLHVVDKGKKSIELYNFYTDGPIVIKLNSLLSPQLNAEKFYRKSKNEAKEIEILKSNIKAKQQIILTLKAQLAAIGDSDNVKNLQKLLPKLPSSTEYTILPYKEFFVNDYKIMVGKNAKHNDTLTLKVAKKDDLWLHAKDVSGSHVVIKHLPGKNYPAYIIEKAAQLAAYYSKRKTDSLCPVLYTPKKYVRKKKGTPAGAMFVEKEKVILVKPSLEI